MELVSDRLMLGRFGMKPVPPRIDLGSCRRKLGPSYGTNKSEGLQFHNSGLIYHSERRVTSRKVKLALVSFCYLNN